MEGNFPQVTNELITKLRQSKNSLFPLGHRKTLIIQNEIPPEESKYYTSRDIKMEEARREARRNSIQGFITGLFRDEEAEKLSAMSHFFHCVHAESAFYICLADDTNGRQQDVNYSFLHDVQLEFSEKFSPLKIERANAYGMQKGFVQTIANQMHYYNTNRLSLAKDHHTSKLSADVDNLKSIMDENIQLIMKRGETMERIIKQSEELLDETKVFQKRGQQLKRVMKKKTKIYKSILIGFCVLFIYLIFASICSFDMSECMDEDR